MHSKDLLPIIEPKPRLGPDIQQVLENGDWKDSRFRIALALEQSGGKKSSGFCHAMEQFRMRNGMLAFPSNQVPCKNCPEYDA